METKNVSDIFKLLQSAQINLVQAENEKRQKDLQVSFDYYLIIFNGGKNLIYTNRKSN